MKGSTARVWSALCVLALAAAACSGASATTTSAPPPTAAPTTLPAPTTTQPPATNTTTASVPPTTLSSEPVGDPAALQALAEQVAFDAGIPFEEFFVPDITQPDPEAALKELLLFSDWALSNQPDTALAAIHTIEGSQAFQRQRSSLDTYESNGWAGRHEPFRPANFNQVDIDLMPMSDADRAGLPAGAIAFQFQSNGEGIEVVDVDTGDVVSTIPPWSNRVIMIIIAPTDVGWQEYWYFIPEFDA